MSPTRPAVFRIGAEDSEMNVAPDVSDSSGLVDTPGAPGGSPPPIPKLPPVLVVKIRAQGPYGDYSRLGNIAVPTEELFPKGSLKEPNWSRDEELPFDPDLWFYQHAMSVIGKRIGRLLSVSSRNANYDCSLFRILGTLYGVKDVPLFDRESWQDYLEERLSQGSHEPWTLRADVPRGPKRSRESRRGSSRTSTYRDSRCDSSRNTSRTTGATSRPDRSSSGPTRSEAHATGPFSSGYTRPVYRAVSADRPSPTSVRLRSPQSRGKPADLDRPVQYLSGSSSIAGRDVREPPITVSSPPVVPDTVVHEASLAQWSHANLHALDSTDSQAGEDVCATDDSTTIGTEEHCVPRDYVDIGKHNHQVASSLGHLFCGNDDDLSTAVLEQPSIAEPMEEYLFYPEESFVGAASHDQDSFDDVVRHDSPHDLKLTTPLSTSHRGLSRGPLLGTTVHAIHAMVRRKPVGEPPPGSHHCQDQGPLLQAFPPPTQLVHDFPVRVCPLLPASAPIDGEELSYSDVKLVLTWCTPGCSIDAEPSLIVHSILCDSNESCHTTLSVPIETHDFLKNGYDKTSVCASLQCVKESVFTASLKCHMTAMVLGRTTRLGQGNCFHSTTQAHSCSLYSAIMIRSCCFGVWHLEAHDHFYSEIQTNSEGSYSSHCASSVGGSTVYVLAIYHKEETMVYVSGIYRDRDNRCVFDDLRDTGTTSDVVVRLHCTFGLGSSTLTIRRDKGTAEFVMRISTIHEGRSRSIGACVVDMRCVVFCAVGNAGVDSPASFLMWCSESGRMTLPAEYKSLDVDIADSSSLRLHWYQESCNKFLRNEGDDRTASFPVWCNESGRMCDAVDFPASIPVWCDESGRITILAELDDWCYESGRMSSHTEFANADVVLLHANPSNDGVDSVPQFTMWCTESGRMSLHENCDVVSVGRKTSWTECLTNDLRRIVKMYFGSFASRLYVDGLAEVVVTYFSVLVECCLHSDGSCRITETCSSGFLASCLHIGRMLATWLWCRCRVRSVEADLHAMDDVHDGIVVMSTADLHVVDDGYTLMTDVGKAVVDFAPLSLMRRCKLGRILLPVTYKLLGKNVVNCTALFTRWSWEPNMILLQESGMIYLQTITWMLDIGSAASVLPYLHPAACAYSPTGVRLHLTVDKRSILCASAWNLASCIDRLTNLIPVITSVLMVSYVEGNLERPRLEQKLELHSRHYSDAVCGAQWIGIVEFYYVQHLMLRQRPVGEPPPSDCRDTASGFHDEVIILLFGKIDQAPGILDEDMILFFGRIDCSCSDRLFTATEVAWTQVPCHPGTASSLSVLLWHCESGRMPLPFMCSVHHFVDACKYKMLRSVDVDSTSTLVLLDSESGRMLRLPRCIDDQPLNDASQWILVQALRSTMHRDPVYVTPSVLPWSLAPGRISLPQSCTGDPLVDKASLLSKIPSVTLLNDFWLLRLYLFTLLWSTLSLGKSGLTALGAYVCQAPLLHACSQCQGNLHALKIPTSRAGEDMSDDCTNSSKAYDHGSRDAPFFLDVKPNLSCVLSDEVTPWFSTDAEPDMRHLVSAVIVDAISVALIQYDGGVAYTVAICGVLLYGYWKTMRKHAHGTSTSGISPPSIGEANLHIRRNGPTEYCMIRVVNYPTVALSLLLLNTVGHKTMAETDVGGISSTVNGSVRVLRIDPEITPRPDPVLPTPKEPPDPSLLHSKETLPYTDAALRLVHSLSVLPMFVWQSMNTSIDLLLPRSANAGPGNVQAYLSVLCNPTSYKFELGEDDGTRDILVPIDRSCCDPRCVAALSKIVLKGADPPWKWKRTESPCLSS